MDFDLSDGSDDDDEEEVSIDPDAHEEFWGDGTPDLHWLSDDHIREMHARAN